MIVILHWTPARSIGVMVRVRLNLLVSQLSLTHRGEPKESFFVRLYDPVGSLSLESPSIAVVSIEASEGTVDENQLPVVDAGSDQTVDAETTVNLQGLSHGCRQYRADLSLGASVRSNSVNYSG